MSADASGTGEGSSSTRPAMAEPTRKRALSLSSETETDTEEMKRPRLAASLSFTASMNESFSSDVSTFSQRSPRTNRVWSARLRQSQGQGAGAGPSTERTALRPRLLSASSSYSDLSTRSRGRSAIDDRISSGMAMLRSGSVSSLDLRSSSPVVQTYPEPSAKHHLKPGRTAIDFAAAPDSAACPMAWSVANSIFFGRGNRIYYKNVGGSEEAAQLCKVRDNHGDLTLLDCGGKDQPHVLASATSKGYIQIWDVTTKKAAMSWQSTGVLAMRWNGPVLTIGGPKGTIRHYDTRVGNTAKMKEQTRKVTRHQAPISGLAWNGEGKLLASGDQAGVIYCWDTRQNVPLDVGDQVQRRRKMQHDGVITALAWCSWQPKILASGDSAADTTGTIRVWNVAGSSSTHHATPNRLALDAAVTSLHFSPICKELLSTHGPGRPPTPATTPLADDREPPVFDYDTRPSRPSRFANSVAVHAFPSLRHVTTVPGASSTIAGSLLSPNGQKVLLAIPGEGKLKVWDVWGKPVIRRQHSALSIDGRIR